MNAESIRNLLKQVESGAVSAEDAFQELKNLPFEEMGFARIDHHRSLRKNLPEVVFAQNKTPEQTAEIMRSMAASGYPAMASRATEAHYQAVKACVHGAEWFADARIIRCNPKPSTGEERYTAIATGGTTDIPVAEEAAITLETLGRRVVRTYDVGVAGIHRLFASLEVLQKARVVIAVAGMEGALPSVTAGLVPCPVIAVPTSIGYGASFGGIAALLTMLNSCAAGVSVVNIDNGFGAACIAHMILGESN